MKVIPLSEAKTRLSHYARLCRKEPIVVTVNGVPAFQLTPVSDEDDLMDQLLEHNAEFRRMLAKRLKEATIPIEEAAKRL
jgi:prevent-host-death family protein